MDKLQRRTCSGIKVDRRAKAEIGSVEPSVPNGRKFAVRDDGPTVPTSSL